MSKPLVYLAGPIAARTYEGAVSWRESVRAALAPDIGCLSPMRGKESIQFTPGLPGVEYHVRDVLVSHRTIVARDFSDVIRCDLVLMDLTLSGPSIGTMVELGWAHACRKPVIAWIGAAEQPTHPFLSVLPSAFVATLEEAARVVRSFLLPG